MVAGFALGLALLLAPSAQGSFPGANGKIAFVRGGDIWTTSPDGTGQVNLTNDAPVQNAPSWSPDGLRLAFDQYDGADRRAWTMQADGSNRVLAYDGVLTYRREPAWSPDGAKIAFVTRFANGNEVIYTMNPDGTAPSSVVGVDISTTPTGLRPAMRSRTRRPGPGAASTGPSTC